MVELVEYVARGLVDHPDQVKVTESVDRDTVFLELQVAPGEAGRVIGREGRLANALRTLLRISAARSRKRVVLDIRV
ncbi:MAG: KH domain-containing protein [Chloroflexi bacterium]|uniref:RNA-binding protein KhpA n=1 Tax=Candidatus Thermofonsia Clade 3 bacterium TaxID=2364212 RepID=A0A2M8QD99_9CHLR|nr:KH domain-containing protein [Candidatus Roseilinea sp. NK_OTU-006]PJF47774.1 MAG: RNA-binding protein [Candidatus Thermofonsia Clade 3 bacterium]RMG61844.1 MAG: KH domain-containing protein [Chloroflexota bacterium]